MRYFLDLIGGCDLQAPGDGPVVAVQQGVDVVHAPMPSVGDQAEVRGQSAVVGGRGSLHRERAHLAWQLQASGAGPATYGGIQKRPIKTLRKPMLQTLGPRNGHVGDTQKRGKCLANKNLENPPGSAGG